MPYKKKVGFRKRRSAAGASWKKYGARAGGLAYRAYQGVRRIQKLINVEKKFFDVHNDTSPSSAGTVISLSNIAQGNDYNNRDGNSILCQSLFFQARVTMNNSASSSFVRIILLVDNDQRGVDPTVAELLETGVVESPLTHDVGRRFNILMDKVVNISGTGDQNKFVKRYINYNQHIKYKDTAGADASAYEGNLFLFMISNEGTNVPLVNWHSRLRFTDN